MALSYFRVSIVRTRVAQGVHHSVCWGVAWSDGNVMTHSDNTRMLAIVSREYESASWLDYCQVPM